MADVVIAALFFIILAFLIGQHKAHLVRITYPKDGKKTEVVRIGLIGREIFCGFSFSMTIAGLAFRFVFMEQIGDAPPYGAVNALILAAITFVVSFFLAAYLLAASFLYGAISKPSKKKEDIDTVELDNEGNEVDDDDTVSRYMGFWPFRCDLSKFFP